ncbi:hypothetical protein Rsub_01177 [Raphidocelis subcapitata]|uniref:CMP/dCMP-type deaminase domain-containing protein n=1 Tax=Raphidocelis subcapitata TaxID=307507 RepID=A0A2V0NLZ1_9CHLO|nr:hypothetical protein Rsub_01177 [Raphidocelis subcapitata]|eukprot:GBF88464.1 hypothetical protein Rsub_01177 [Raphidocelis subcapitata]
MAATGDWAYQPARRVAGRIPPTLQLVEALVANVEPQHAAPLVKTLARDLPLGALQHLKRVRRREGAAAHPAMMQLILHTVEYITSGEAAAAVPAAEGHGGGGGGEGGGEGGRGRGRKRTPAAPAGSGGGNGGGCAASTCTCFAAHHTHRHPTTHVVTQPPSCTGRCAACGGVAPAAATPAAAAAATAAAAAPADAIHCPTPEIAAAAALLPPRVAEALAVASAQLDVLAVPGVAPDNRDQWSEWNVYWPMPWKLPSGQPHQDGQTVCEADQAYFERHMARVLEASAAAGGANVCVIVDPASGEVIAEGADCGGQHPLRHAAMEAVTAAAERDLRLWPVNGFVHVGRQDDTSSHIANAIPPDSDGGGSDGGDSGSGEAQQAEQAQGQQQQGQQQQDEHALSGLKHCHSQADSLGAADGPAKRQRVNGAAATSSSSSQPANGHAPGGGDGADPRRQEQRQEQQQAEAEAQAAADADMPPAGPPPPQRRPPSAGASGADSDGAGSRGGSRGASRTPVPITNWANKPYLCNTYDAFLLREPCAMCGMALVHSRLARVVYAELNPQHGALGGAFRLQANRSLNHHYDVFHMPAGARGAAPAAGRGGGRGGGGGAQQ